MYLPTLERMQAGEMKAFMKAGLVKDNPDYSVTIIEQAEILDPNDSGCNHEFYNGVD